MASIFQVRCGGCAEIVDLRSAPGTPSNEYGMPSVDDGDAEKLLGWYSIGPGAVHSNILQTAPTEHVCPACVEKLPKRLRESLLALSARIAISRKAAEEQSETLIGALPGGVLRMPRIRTSRPKVSGA